MRRIRLHRRIADALESAYARSIDAHLAELAFHFVEAVLGSAVTDLDGSDELRGKAIDYARRAGDQASRSLAYEEAARLYAMALRVLRTGTERDERLEAQILIAEATHSLGLATWMRRGLASSRQHVSLEQSARERFWRRPP